jgi:hypothetical protein
MAIEVPLGSPRRTIQRVAGGVIGVPIGLGVVMPPHGLLVGLGGAAYVSFLVGWNAIARASWRRFATDNNLALGALGRGELAKAHEAFVRWALSRYTTIRAIARHNLGWTLMVEGHVSDAATILEDAATHYQPALTRQAMLPTTRLDVALCHALLGDFEKAEAWYAMAQEPVKASPNPSFGGGTALVRSVIDCRNGRASEAAVALEHAWEEHETTLIGGTLRLMRVVRAFACAAADGPRSQGIVERVLGDTKPRYEREFSFLGDTWPEMAAFLVAHGLAR